MIKRILVAIVISWTMFQASTALTAPGVIRGIAGSNHMLNLDFDFALTIPGGWDNLDATRLLDNTPQPTDVWRFSNARVAGKIDTSTMQVEFYSSIPAKDLSELRVFVESRYKNFKWTDYVDHSLVGIRSNEVSDPTDARAKFGHLFYFMDRNMVVAVHWRRHPSNAGDRGISELILSMDRRTSPPILDAIQFSKAGTVKPGERFCTYLKVNDLKSSFNASSLKKLQIAGVGTGFIWRDITWNEEKGQFEACLSAPTSTSSAADLAVIGLEIENERDRSLNCYLTPPNVQLTCSSYNSGSQPYMIEQNPPQVDNPKPDRMPPELDGIDVDQTGGNVHLKLTVHEESGFLGGWIELQQIPGGREKIFVAPWQLSSGQIDLDITAYSSSGTRRVTQVVLADRNGFGAAYADCGLVTDSSVQCKPGVYARCLEGKKCQATGLAVVEYFSSKRKKQ